MVAERVWPTAKITIARPDGSISTHEKARFVAVPGEPIRVFDSTGFVIAELDPSSENEVSSKLVTYHHETTGEHWSVQQSSGGCGCGQ